MKVLYTTLLVIILMSHGKSQHSIAMEWSEILLTGIRGDFARPVVHARNLFHASAAMYDAWAAYDGEADTYFLGNTFGDFTFEFEDFEGSVSNVQEAREKAISYAMYRLLRHRFLTSPGAWRLFTATDSLMQARGYNPGNTSIDYQSGDPAALGNYISNRIIQFGIQDGANEMLGYENTYYEPVNGPLVIAQPGNPNIIDPNKWQPITLDVFIDQSGNVIPFNTPEFLGPEWGNVHPFALTEHELDIYTRDGNDWKVYYDPGEPWKIKEGLGLEDPYKWGFALVAIWSSHLGTAKDTLIDISPASLGNNDFLPQSFEEYTTFYNLEQGGVGSSGHTINPRTNEPYVPQMVLRSDYARVLAEFWADGPDSETPPGHWFTILNHVNSHPDLVRKFAGKGEIVDNLEWDVKCYLTLGGAMHDCAIAAWGIKGYYDYIRPASAIRYMAEKGQSSNPDLPNYHPHGFPLLEGYSESVEIGDPLAGNFNQHVGEVKILAWRGPDYIDDPKEDKADVGWILAKNWWPYQRPTFVTPPFAGYISGHSTFSRAAAEVLTFITGDPYFPGGMGVFHAPQNEYLVFEVGPSADIDLQWATYRDASDQTSLSRIWGGIHPPVDDIPGRRIGEQIGKQSFGLAQSLFYKDNDKDGFFSYEECNDNDPTVYPGAPEICDGLDNNCNGVVDEGLPLFVYYQDIDLDGYGNALASITTCASTPPSGWVVDNTDCDDNNNMIFPGAPEIADNGIDEDCSGKDKLSFAFTAYDAFNRSLQLYYPESLLADVQIYNIIGQLVLAQQIDFTQNNYSSLNLEDAQPGTYVIVLRDNDGNILYKNKFICPN